MPEESHKPHASAIKCGAIIYTAPTKMATPILVAISAEGIELWRHVEPLISVTRLPALIDGNGTVLFPMQVDQVFQPQTTQQLEATIQPTLHLIALSPIDGTELWHVSLDDGIFINSAPTIADDGTLYVTTSDGFLVAFGSGPPEPDRELPPFKYKKVVTEGDMVGGFLIDFFDDFEILPDGRVSFRAWVSSTGTYAVFIEQLDGTFEVIARGDSIDMFVVDDVALPRFDSQGNRYMGTRLADVGPAIMVNDKVFVAERASANPRLLVSMIEDWTYVDPNNVGQFLIHLRSPSGSTTLNVVELETATTTTLLSTGSVIAGFVINTLNPYPVRGFGDDGMPILQVSNGLFAIATPTEIIARSGDLISGRQVQFLEKPQRTEAGEVYFRDVATNGRIIFHALDHMNTALRRSGDTIAGIAVLDVGAYTINDRRDLAYRIQGLGGRANILDDHIVVASGLTKINGILVNSLPSENDKPISLNNNRQIAFLASRIGEPETLWVATLLLFDIDNDDDVDEADLILISGCYDGITLDTCSCTAIVEPLSVPESMCCDAWEELKRTWTGPSIFPPFSTLCDTDCNANTIADELELQAGLTPDCNTNLIPDGCDLSNGKSTDLDGDGLLDECCAPPELLSNDLEGTRNRYLTISISPTILEFSSYSQSQAIQIQLDNMMPPFDMLNGLQMWVGPPSAECENSGQGRNFSPQECDIVGGAANITSMVAMLQCEPYFAPWHDFGAVQVYHEIIVPASSYSVRLVFESCGISAIQNFSQPLNILTSRWGDVTRDCTGLPCQAADGRVDITTDVTAILDKFKNVATGPQKSRCDLEPEIPDWVINFTDVTLSLDAFRSLGYPYLPPSTPCP